MDKKFTRSDAIILGGLGVAVEKDEQARVPVQPPIQQVVRQRVAKGLATQFRANRELETSLVFWKQVAREASSDASDLQKRIVELQGILDGVRAELMMARIVLVLWVAAVIWRAL